MIVYMWRNRVVPMGNNLKYSKSAVSDMASSGAAFEELFLNADSLQIMYCLAEKNPHLKLLAIVEKTNLSEEIVTSLITKMISKQIVTYSEKEKGYTLTEVGLASLYNFHKDYVENAH